MPFIHKMEFNVANWFLLLGFIVEKIECTLLEINVTSNITSYVNRNASIVCSYTVLTNDTEVDSILLQRDDSALVQFSSENNINKATYYESGSSLKERSEIFNNMSTIQSVSVMIQPLHCTEQGIYQFVFKTKNRTTDVLHGKRVYSDVVALSVQKHAEIPREVILVSGRNYEEDETVEVICSVDVGNPAGKVEWWILQNNISEKKLISNDISYNKCGQTLNLKMNYNVSRTDDGAVFKCSVRNKLNDDFQQQKSEQIMVFYPVQSPVITRHPSKSSYTAGLSYLSLICSAEGNPRPNTEDYKWRFKAENSSSYENIGSVGKVLNLTNLSTNHSGEYECRTLNTYLNKTFISSSAVDIRVHDVNIPTVTPSPRGCRDNPCSIVETCVKQENAFKCNINTWTIISFVFILSTLVFLTATLVMFVKLRKSEFGVGDKSSNGTSMRTSYFNDIPMPDRTGTTQEDGTKLYAEIQKR